MGRIEEPRPVLLLLAAFSRDREAFTWVRETAQSAWGSIALTSDVFDFEETDYYEPTMGANLKKVFFVFHRLIDPAGLLALKRRTNRWEATYAKMGQQSVPNSRVDRPLNLDPGYLTEAKLILASTKDHTHRIYLSRGIYAEVTLHFRGGGWQSHDWTYPDYRRKEYHIFFTQCREYLRRRLSGDGTP